MEAVFLIGVQGSGKTSFYRERFFDTHMRISRDMLKTRDREALLIGACFAARQAFVLDNTNLVAAERAPYVTRAKAAGYRTIAYWLRVEIRAAIARNSKRTDKKPLPVPALLRSHKLLEPPTVSETFDKIFVVTLDKERNFVVAPFAD